MENCPVITINLEENFSAHSFAENTIHIVELERVKEIIKRLKALPDTNERLHNTITVSGTRGSGKTSFLMTLLENNEITNNCEVLKIIDPTLVEEKGHIFLSIVSYIKEKVDEQISFGKIQEGSALEDWRNSLNALAKGLPVLNGVDSGVDLSDWNDPIFVMNEGLKRVKGANHLEENFHVYVKKSLELLGKNFFIIAFDDVDTDFSRGTPILEMMRKYLTTKQVITFLSGDLNLYSLLIRKKQWENFGKSLLKNEYDQADHIEEFKSERYIDLVSQLESQYMMKILKPEFRIALSTVGEKVEANKMNVQIQRGGSKIQLKEFYINHIFSYWGVKERGLLNLYWRFFSTLPIRSQLSLLRAYKDYSEDDEKLVENITDVFYSELKTKNVDIWDLVRGYGLPTIHILHFLVENHILDEGSQLYPRTNDPMLNASLTTLGVVLGIRMRQKPLMLFDFIVRICNVADKVNKWELKKTENRIEDPDVDEYIDFSRCYYDYGLKKIACIQSAYCASFGRNINIFNEGMIPVARLQYIDKQRRDENNLRFDEVFNLEDKQSWKEYVAYIPLMAVQDRFGRSQLYFSFYNLLAAIGDLLSVQVEDYVTQLTILSQLRYFPMLSNSNLHIEEKEADEDEVDIENSSEVVGSCSLLKDYVERLADWAHLYPKKVFTPYLIARIMIRTNYSFSNIKYSKYTSVAYLFHKYIVCFLNAVLVEEMLDKNRGAEFLLSNPTDKDNVFVENLKRIIKIVEQESIVEEVTLEDKQNNFTPIFNFFVKCPLLMTYINAEGELGEQLRTWGYKEDLSIFDDLAKVHILGSKTEEIINTPVIIERQNRTVWNTDEDARMIAEVLKRDNKNLDYENIKWVIRSYFTNQRIYDSRIQQLIQRITMNGYMTKN